MATDRVSCFWTTPTEYVALYLRRYVTKSKCAASGMTYHNAMMYIGDALAKHPQGKPHILDVPDRVPLTDARWPERCKCGYVFQLDDTYQVFQDRIYTPFGQDTPRWQQRELPPGAMYDAFWMPRENKQADHIYLVCVLPDGKHWNVDGPASNGLGWERTGRVPNITAKPSIQTDKWHGFLTDGELVPC